MASPAIGTENSRDPKGYCAVEYAYNLMAQAAGIITSPCRLLEENGRQHFMTKTLRPSRTAAAKLHMQSLGALAHFDFNAAGAHSYEQALLVVRQLGLSMGAVEEQFPSDGLQHRGSQTRDDHVKNIAFLMDKQGTWSLAPAFDITYAYNPKGLWTSRHQMSMNGKREGFVRGRLPHMRQVRFAQAWTGGRPLSMKCWKP